MGDCNKFNIHKRANMQCNQGSQITFKKHVKSIEHVFCISKSRVSLLIVSELLMVQCFQQILCAVMVKDQGIHRTRLFYPFSML